MKNKILETIKKFNITDNQTECVEVCVSGGIDSVSLLHFFINNINVKIIVTHVNHMLRGNEASR